MAENEPEHREGDPPNSVRGFGFFGDNANPYNPADPLHASWENASVQAEEEISRIRSKILPDRLLALRNEDAAAYSNSIVLEFLGSIEIVARTLATAIVFSYAGAYEHIRLISSYGDQFVEAMRSREFPAFVNSGDLVTNLRMLLLPLVAHCKAEALKLARYYETAVQARKILARGSRTGYESESEVKPGPSETPERIAVQAFLSRCKEAGRKITRKNIWIAAGYKERTEFQRYQRGDPLTTTSGRTAFDRVLSMEPKDFFRLLETKSAQN